MPVTLAKVVRKAMPLEQRDRHGTVEASSSAAVRAQITGELTSVNFKEGDDVEQGQVLFTLDRRPLEAALKQAEAALARDQAQLANDKMVHPGNLVRANDPTPLVVINQVTPVQVSLSFNLEPATRSATPSNRCARRRPRRCRRR